MRGPQRQHGSSSAQGWRREALRGCLNAGEEGDGIGFNYSFVRDGSNVGTLMSKQVHR